MRKHPYSRKLPKQTITFNEEALASLKGTCPYYRPNKVHIRGIRKPIGELATQTDALRYPGTHEAFSRRTYYRVRKGERPLSPPSNRSY